MSDWNLRGTVNLLLSWDTIIQLAIVIGMLVLLAPLGISALEAVSITSDKITYSLGASGALLATVFVRIVNESTPTQEDQL